VYVVRQLLCFFFHFFVSFYSIFFISCTQVLVSNLEDVEEAEDIAVHVERALKRKVHSCFLYVGMEDIIPLQEELNETARYLWLAKECKMNAEARSRTPPDYQHFEKIYMSDEDFVVDRSMIDIENESSSKKKINFVLRKLMGLRDTSFFFFFSFFFFVFFSRVLAGQN
jgi:hypothetical protein